MLFRVLQETTAMGKYNANHLRNTIHAKAPDHIHDGGGGGTDTDDYDGADVGGDFDDDGDNDNNEGF